MDNLDSITKLSQLVELAINDMASVKKDKRYKFDVYKWHVPEGNKCFVCVAGAIMAKSLSCNWEMEYKLSHFRNRDRRLLESLDLLRNGHIYLARELLFKTGICINIDKLNTCYMDVDHLSLQKGYLNSWKKLLRLLKENDL